MSPQKEDGFTPIANELLEAFYRCKLLEYERCVVMCIWRKTYGWSKKEDWVSNSQIEVETGIALPNITRTLRSLAEKKIICRNGKRVSVNKKYGEWVVEWRRLSHQITKVISPDNKKLSHQIPTKERKKLTKETIEQSSKKLKANQEDMGFKKYADDFEEEVQLDHDYAPEKPKNKKGASEAIQSVFNLFNNPAKNVWYLRPLERESAKVLLETYGLETLKKRIDRIDLEKKKNPDDPFFPLVVTPSQLLDKMEAVERYLKNI